MFNVAIAMDIRSLTFAVTASRPLAWFVPQNILQKSQRRRRPKPRYIYDLSEIN